MENRVVKKPYDSMTMYSTVLVTAKYGSMPKCNYQETLLNNTQTEVGKYAGIKTTDFRVIFILMESFSKKQLLKC